MPDEKVSKEPDRAAVKRLRLRAVTYGLATVFVFFLGSWVGHGDRWRLAVALVALFCRVMVLDRLTNTA